MLDLLKIAPPVRHSLVTRDSESNSLKSLCDLRRVVVVSEEDPLKDDKVGHGGALAVL